jgi:hypothetical protein
MTTTTLRKKLTDRRQARAARQDLLRDLASYRTPREVNDLLAAFEDHEDADVDAMRTVLTRQLERETALFRA